MYERVGKGPQRHRFVQNGQGQDRDRGRIAQTRHEGRAIDPRLGDEAKTAPMHRFQIFLFSPVIAQHFAQRTDAAVDCRI